MSLFFILHGWIPLDRPGLCGQEPYFSLSRLYLWDLGCLLVAPEPQLLSMNNIDVSPSQWFCFSEEPRLRQGVIFVVQGPIWGCGQGSSPQLLEGGLRPPGGGRAQVYRLPIQCSFHRVKARVVPEQGVAGVSLSGLDPHC